MVKNPPSNAGDSGSIPGQGTKIPHTSGLLSLTEPAHSRASTLQREMPTLSNEDPVQPKIFKNKNTFLLFKSVYDTLL